MAYQPSRHLRLTPRACPACGGTRKRLLFRQDFACVSAGSLLEGYDVVICDECGLGFADHIPDQATFDAYYRDMSKYEQPDRGGGESRCDLARFRGIAELVRPFLPSREAHLLDIGCATGQLLALFREDGYLNVVGLDPSPVCASVAQRLHGLRVLNGTLADITDVVGSDKPFHCVLMSAVLEHLRDIGPALDRVVGLLAADGLLFAEVPDATEFARWPDAPFQQFSTEHINYFSPASLASLMRRHSLVQILSQQVPRQQSHGTVMPVVSAIFRKESSLPAGTVERDTQTERGLSEYIERSRMVEAAVHRAVGALVERAVPVVVWGVGTHTQRLLATSQMQQARIAAFVDSNPHYQGKELGGIPIIAPCELRGRTEPILISSRVYQREIEQQIREELGLDNELILLYEV